MATARFARPRSLAVLIAALASLGTLLVPAATSQAAPTVSISEVQARIHALNEQAERITESYNLARERLTTLRRERTVAGHELARQQTRLGRVQKAISATADAAYRGGGGLGGGLMLGSTDDPQTFLDQAVLLDALSRSQAEQFASAAAAGHAVAVAKTTYAAKATIVHASVQRIATQKQHIESLLSQAHNLLNQLRADQRARLAAAAASSAAQQTALRSTYHGPASGQAAVAVRFAYAQLGKPYVYGGAGPSSYDCSGLTMRAWGAAGVALPHNAAAQQSMTHYVDRASLQPGDLVFFGSPAYHVGIYIGGGRFIHAPHTGDVVRIAELSYMPSFAGGGRP